jgi:hypothetical protein
MGLDRIQALVLMGSLFSAGGVITSALGLYRLLAAKSFGLLATGISLALLGAALLGIAHRAYSSV